MDGRGYRTCWTSATRPLVCMGGASQGKKRKKEKGQEEREDLTLSCVLESESVYIW